MTFSDAIINTYGIERVLEVLKHPQAVAILREAVQRDCQNYRAHWGAWKHVMNSIRNKVGE